MGSGVICYFQGSSRYTFLFGIDAMVFKNHGYKWFAVVMVFTLSRLENGRFRRNSVCCGPVYGPWLSLRFGYGPVYDSRLTGAHAFGPKKIYVVPKILMKQPHDCSY